MKAESRRPWRCRLAACLVSLIPLPVAAQVPSAGSLTLAAALERALAANPSIVAARLRGPVDAAGLAVARERPNPEASYEVEKETPKQSIGIAVPLELGGKRDKRIAVGQAVVRAGEAALAATIARVRNEVRRAYFDVLVAEARLALAQELLDVAVRVRDSAQQRFDAGGAPRLEVMQAQLALASSENDVAGSRAGVIASRAALNALLGQPLDMALTLVSSIDSGVPLARDAALALAHDGNTELRIIDRQIDAQRARVALAGALRIPDIVPTATLTTHAAPEFDYGWRVGVALAVPIFTTHRAGFLLEQSTLDQLTAERRAVLSQLDAQVSAAATLTEAHRQLYLRYRDDIVPQAAQVEQVAQDSYQLGQTGIVALLQALQASRDVRLRSLQAVSQFQTSLADLERAIGAPLP